jgi:Carboxypeptidase regulatory-like domain/TonB dependent receptor
VHVSFAKGVFVRVILVAVFGVVLCPLAFAQSPTGSIGGIVFDPDAKTIPGAEIIVVNDLTRVQYETKTNNLGIYAVPNLPPGPYRVQASKVGFKTLIKPDIVLNVQDSITINFTLPIGATSIAVTVEGGAPMINTTDAAVSTVVDRQFAENLPMNGRSFQTLIELTPGVVLTPSSVFDGGQFSVNGQRAASNYWMVDGVSANFGAGGVVGAPGNGSAGALPSFSVLGGTNSLVSVDALQEFRIQTSTYAPEFGRTPGGQISIVTRSGTNQFHGTAFDYLRNDVFDASNWFNGYTNNPALPKAEERQNDFGGTWSGPIFKDHTFFFFSYEGLRLRLPQTAITNVPDMSARQNAVPALQPYLNAFPFDPNQPDLGNGIAQFNASFSNPATLDAYSLRVDHKLNADLTIFGRYNYSPSSIVQRGSNGNALSSVTRDSLTTQTVTVGTTWSVSPTVANDFRFNYSRTNGENHSFMDDFREAVPLTSLPFPAPYTAQNATFVFHMLDFNNGNILSAGQGSHRLQRQVNLTDNLSAQKGSHSLKFGADFRRLSPVYDPAAYSQSAVFFTTADAEAGNLGFGFLVSARTSTLLFHNLGVFAQDTWRMIPRLTLTYGLRWDADFAPSAASGPSLLAVTGYNLNDLSTLAIAPAGTPPFKTTYGNVAPRIGVAYQASQSQNWQTVLRGGFGVFYDLATSQAGNAYLGGSNYPFGGFDVLVGTAIGGTSKFPLSPSDAGPPPITPASLSPGGTSSLYAFDPNLKLPYTLEWNVAFEQALGTQQAISASYIGAIGRRLLQTAFIFSPNPNFGSAYLIGNTATSDYNALQLQFQRRLSHGLQALASYSWSHSIDTGSAGSFANASNRPVPGSANQNRGPSDFDIRNAFSAGVTYDIPAPKKNALMKTILRGWSTENFILARSASPVDISYRNTFNQNIIKGGAVNIRPDVVPNQPFYLYGSQYPGGKALNAAAFTPPPTDANGNPLRQGDLGRNTLRGFGAAQWDFAVHRDFPIHESLKLQFRAEMLNLLNHPNFGPPSSIIDQGGFGIATQMLGQSLTDFVGTGGFDPLYQIGGPRSVQFALKLSF